LQSALGAITPCEPPEQDIKSPWDFSGSGSFFPQGKYQFLYVAMEQHWPTWCTKWAYDVLEFEVIE
jgi:hypothetical protein